MTSAYVMIDVLKFVMMLSLSAINLWFARPVPVKKYLIIMYYQGWIHKNKRNDQI